MRRAPTTFLLVLGCLLVAAVVRAEQTLPDPRQPNLPSESRLEVLMERVRIEHSKLETLEAEFVQHKESGLLIEPSEARGVFSYQAPDRVRWEYQTPDPISLLIDGEQMTTWYRDLDQAERTNVGRHSQRILEYLGAGTSVETLSRYFEARLAIPKDTAEPFRLELLPRFERVAKRLHEMTLWIHPEAFLPVRVRYIEADGDTTEYHFENLRVNDGIPDERFLLELPGEVDLREIDFGGSAARR